LGLDWVILLSIVKYWIGKNNQQLGPFELSEVQRMVMEGKIAVTDLAWTEGMPNWSPVSQVIPGAAPASAADLGKTQPVLGQRNPMPVVQEAAPVAPVSTPMEPAPVPVWTPPPAAAAPVQPQWTPPSPEPQHWTPTAPAPQAAPYNPQQQYAPQPQYTPQPQVPQQYAPPQPQYQQQRAPVGGPVPPGMNWIVVLVLLMIPFFGLYWFYNELSFVKKIDPKSKALTMFFATFGLILLYILLVVAGLLIGDTMAIVLSGLGALCALGAMVCQIMAVFNARASLLYYYNNVENIGLKLSPVMTFFFNLLYFQYHFQRIAEWKGGAPLRPQA